MQRDPFPDSNLGELEFVYSARPSILPSCSKTRPLTSSILFSSFDSFFLRTFASGCVVQTAVVGMSRRASSCTAIRTSCGAMLGPAVQSLRTAVGGIQRTRSFSGRFPFVALALLNGLGLQPNEIVSLQQSWFCSRVDGSFLLVLPQFLAKASV